MFAFLSYLLGTHWYFFSTPYVTTFTLSRSHDDTEARNYVFYRVWKFFYLFFSSTPVTCARQIEKSSRAEWWLGWGTFFSCTAYGAAYDLMFRGFRFFFFLLFSCSSLWFLGNFSIRKPGHFGHISNLSSVLPGIESACGRAGGYSCWRLFGKIEKLSV